MKLPPELRDEPGLNAWCILHTYRGSIAHGMYEPPENPLSIDDKDTIAICVPPLRYYYGLSEYGSRGTREIKKGQWDTVCYEARKAVKMLMNGNPNMLSMLWTSDNYIIGRSPAGWLLRDNRDLFVGRHTYASFVGYAKGQFHKMKSNTGLGYLGNKRKKIVEEFGYDTKNAAHLIRLLRMGIEFLRDGEMRVDRGGLDATELLAIKHGEWTLAQVEDEANRLFRTAEDTHTLSRLPARPEKQPIADLLIEVVAQGLREPGPVT